MAKLYVKDTILHDVNNLDGFYQGCILSGSLAPAPGADVVFINCASGMAGLVSPVLNMSASMGSNVSFRAYSGGITVENVTDASFTSTMEFVAGKLTISSSCTDGFISARGIATIADNGSITVETGSLVHAGLFDNITATAVTDPELDNKVTEVWQLHGLDTGSALVVTQTARTFGSVSQSIATVGSGSEQQTTITRST